LERGSEVCALEAKAAKTVRTEGLSGLRSFRDYHGKGHRAVVLYLGEVRKDSNGIELWPWQDGIREIFGR
jgi:hypothetical protein